MTRTIADLPVVEFSGELIMSGRYAAEQARVAQELGPIYKWVIPQGGDRGEYLFMVGPEANRFVLHTGRRHFSHDRGWTPIIGEMFGRGLLNMDDPEHARHRKMWNPAFTAASMEAYLPVIRQVVAERTATWIGQPEIDVYREAREITFDIAARALADIPVGPQLDRLRGLFYTLLHGTGDLFETWEAYLMRAMTARSELTRSLLGLIAERRRRPDNEQPRDVLGTMVRARDEEGHALSDEQLLAHLNILLVAGHETTTTLGSYVLYLLATMPAWRARIEAELESLVSPGEPISVEAVRGMRQLDNFIKEAGRLFPPVINVPRGVVEDFEFGGYHIPAGTQVRLALAAGHLLPEVFAEPFSFDPDRFAPPREEDRRTPYALVTFGGGPRICIGINFAQIEVKVLAAHVLRHYHMAVLPGQQIVHAGHWNATLPDGIRMEVKSL